MSSENVMEHMLKPKEIWTEVEMVISIIQKKLGLEEVSRKKEPAKDINVNTSER